MVDSIVNTAITHENYLYLRRQLGEQDNGDLSFDQWNSYNSIWRRECIAIFNDRVRVLEQDRDLSWNAYLHVSPSAGRTYQTRGQWDALPLFIKAAIIKPGNAPQARQLDPTRRSSDVPIGSENAW